MTRGDDGIASICMDKPHENDPCIRCGHSDRALKGLPQIKVFRVNEYEWWAGESLESIRAAYKENTGIDPDSEEGFENPREVGEAGMSRLIIFDDGPETASQTFREHLAHLIASGREFPCYFAGTEC